MRKLKIVELNRLNDLEFKTVDKIPLVIVLDNVRSLHNVGSVFRTSDAFRVERIYLCGITATPPHPEIHKTALGAENTVEWVYSKETLDAIRLLKSSGYRIWSAEQAEGSVSLSSLQIGEGKHAVVLGNEVHGVNQAVIDRSDGCIEIPQFGTKHSLNISVASGIVIWEIFKQLSHHISDARCTPKKNVPLRLV